MKQLRFIVWASALCAVLASCASIAIAPDVDNVTTLVDRLAQGGPEGLFDVVSDQFVYDQELLKRESDVLLLWERLFDAGISFDGAEVLSVAALDDDSYRLFGDSFEMRSFFERYLRGAPAIARIRVGAEEYLLLVGGGRNGVPELFGMRGPLR